MTAWECELCRRAWDVRKLRPEDLFTTNSEISNHTGIEHA